METTVPARAPRPRHGVRALGLVVLAVLVACGGGPPAPEDPTATAPATSTSDPPGARPNIGVGGTLERAGSDLVGRVTVTNAGRERIWVPVGRAGATRARLLPAAAGGGLVDLGWVLPPAPVDVEGLDPAFTFRPVAAGERLELDATDAPPPPEALVDPSGAPVEVTGYRLCVDAFADAALAPEARTPVAGSADVVVEVAAIAGETTRTCGPTLDA